MQCVTLFFTSVHFSDVSLEFRIELKINITQSAITSLVILSMLVLVMILQEFCLCESLVAWLTVVFKQRIIYSLLKQMLLIIVFGFHVFLHPPQDILAV